MLINFKASNIYQRNYESTKKIKCNEGGARSSKTYSILQVLDSKAYEETGERYSIVRKTYNALKDTVLRDFFDILKSHDLYNEANHKRSDPQEYTLNGNLFEFRGMDQPDRKRGAKRKRLFMNEAQEFTLEDWRQLTMRTTGEIFLDYNPSEEFSFIYDKIIPREDCELIHSTYKDNPFLEQEIIKELERLELEDPDYWEVYGLGKRGKAKELIYSNWEVFKENPVNIDETFYGLDFGWNHPTALVRIDLCDEVPYITELLYETHLKTPDLIDMLKELIPNKSDNIYADSAEPAIIQEIFEAGFNIDKSDKSVSDGIEYCQRGREYIRGHNLEKEQRNYKWKKNKEGEMLNKEPVKYKDDLMDAKRYARYTHTKQPSYTIGEWV